MIDTYSIDPIRQPNTKPKRHPPHPSKYNRAMHDPASAAAEDEPERARIQQDLGRLLEVWATLSEDTKAFLQMQAAIPSATTHKAAGQAQQGPQPPLPPHLAAAFAHVMTTPRSSSTLSLATLVPPASPLGGGCPSPSAFSASTASSAATSPQRPSLLPRAPSPALSSLSVSSSSSTSTSSGSSSSSSSGGGGGGGGAQQHRLEPVPRAPENVFVLRDEEVRVVRFLASALLPGRVWLLLLLLLAACVG